MLDRPQAVTYRDFEGSVARAALVHVSDEEPGIRRRGAGRGFFYLDPAGLRLSEGPHLRRIRDLAIPPAWSDVWICVDPDGHIQATGRDARGRKQYRYHPRWSACRDEVKYSSLAAFARALPAIRAKVDADLRRRGLPRDKVLASIVWLLDNTMIRVGNAAYARENRSFGLTTLKSRHVEIAGSTLRFAFKGKSGKEWRLSLADRRIARVLRSIQELPGQALFQYLDEEGSRHGVASHDVNDYIREASGSDFTSKHFRTWGGTHAALTLFASAPPPGNRTAMRRALNTLIDAVAARLGNTRTVCRSCYIHPAVIEAWESGALADTLASARRSFRKPVEGLDEEETLLLRWLEARQG